MTRLTFDKLAGMGLPVVGPGRTWARNLTRVALTSRKESWHMCSRTVCADSGRPYPAGLVDSFLFNRDLFLAPPAILNAGGA